MTGNLLLQKTNQWHALAYREGKIVGEAFLLENNLWAVRTDELAGSFRDSELTWISDVGNRQAEMYTAMEQEHLKPPDQDCPKCHGPLGTLKFTQPNKVTLHCIGMCGQPDFETLAEVV